MRATDRDKNIRTLYGFFIGSVPIIQGSSGGWTLIRNGAGLYIITFDEPFADIPGVGCSVQGGVIAITPWTASSLTFVTSATIGGAAADNNVGFVIVGRVRK